MNDEKDQKESTLSQDTAETLPTSKDFKEDWISQLIRESKMKKKRKKNR